MDKLIQLLKRLEKDDTIVFQEFLNSGHPTIDEIERTAVKLLICERGGPDWDAMAFLKKRGYPVFPVEQDRFGWLIGGISTTKGVVTYG